MKSRAAAFALAVSLLCSRLVISAPLPMTLSGMANWSQKSRLSFAGRAVEVDENSGKKKVEDRKDSDRKPERNTMKRSFGEHGSDSSRDEPKNLNGTDEKGNGTIPVLKENGMKHASNTSSSGESSETTYFDAAGGAGKKATSTEGDSRQTGSEDEHMSRRMTTSELIAEARAHSRRLMKGGFVEFVEWLFVVILVAPGTFPVFGCVLLSCANFWRRRLGLSNPSMPAPGIEAAPRAGVSNGQPAYQRVPHGDHGALVARARNKGGTDERENESP